MNTPGQLNRTAEITGAIEGIASKIRLAEQAYGREPNSVSLLAVSKTRPASDVLAAIGVGHREFGENYVDEAVAKIGQIQSTLAQDISRDIVWHYIGAIQSNKTKLIANHFNWVHGVDRLKIAERLSHQRAQELPPLNCCIQVNVDTESSKAGISRDGLSELVDAMSDLPNIRLRGLMAIPAPRQDFAEQRLVFKHMCNLMSTLQLKHTTLDTLSMGMTGDMEAAIAEGATIVRVGTAIFGARTKSG